MFEINEAKRIELLKYLLLEIKDNSSELLKLKKEIESLSCDFYKDALKENSSEIQTVLYKYNENNSRIKEINLEITSKINSWYEFTKDHASIKKLLYPLIFIFRKKALRKFILLKNEAISAITIDNRFVKEKLTLLEHQLEITAIQKIKSDGRYSCYEDLSEKFDCLISEIRYLVPTIQGLCPVTLDIDSIDALLCKLSAINAA